MDLDYVLADNELTEIKVIRLRLSLGKYIVLSGDYGPLIIIDNVFKPIKIKAIGLKIVKEIIVNIIGI